MNQVTPAMHEPTTAQTTSTAKAEPTLPGPPLAARRTAFRFWVALAVTGGVFVAAVAAAGLVTVPYVAFEPGNAYETEQAVAVADGVTVYPADGEVLFLTVSLNIRPTVLEAGRLWLDPDAELVDEDLVLGGRSEEENRIDNLRAITDSKDIAAAVALARLGYSLSPTGTGASVVAVEPDTAAEVAGLVAGDTVVAVDGQPILLREDLIDAIATRAPGAEVNLTVEDVDGAQRTVTPTLGPRPDDPAVAFLGIQLATRDFDAGLPFAVDIDSGAVGGPSAGLAFTLAVIDVLEPGELTGGQVIAVTGTMEVDGTIGPIGGIQQKTAVAAAAGAEVMLVPAALLEDAQANSHGLQIIGVANLDEALAALESIGGDPIDLVAAAAAP